MKKSLIIVLVLSVLLVILAGCSKRDYSEPKTDDVITENKSSAENRVSEKNEEPLSDDEGSMTRKIDSGDIINASGDESGEFENDLNSNVTELSGTTKKIVQEENAIIETENVNGLTTVKTFNFSYDNKFVGVTVAKEFDSVEEAKEHLDFLMNSAEYSQICQNLKLEGKVVFYDIEGEDDGTTKEALYEILQDNE